MLERLRDADTSGYSAQAQELLDRLWRERDATKLTPELVEIPAREYEVGCDSGDKDEQPRHPIELDAYSIGRAHVTNEQFLEFNPNYSQSRTSPHPTSPAVDITWYEAMMYCRWCLGSAGRLPTEAEWEVAAQGPSCDGRVFPWGDGFDETRANIDNPRGAATPYDKFPPNEFGLYDMCGNVFDWCLDWYDETSYRSGPIVNPIGALVGRYRSMRGGSWARPIESGRCAYRVRQVPETRDVLVGFRVARGQKPQMKGAGDER
jgi:formylglycine-generating enzyme required for sulfatase activity